MNINMKTIWTLKYFEELTFSKTKLRKKLGSIETFESHI